MPYTNMRTIMDKILGDPLPFSQSDSLYTRFVTAAQVFGDQRSSAGLKTSELKKLQNAVLESSNPQAQECLKRFTNIFHINSLVSDHPPRKSGKFEKTQEPPIDRNWEKRAGALRHMRRKDFS